ncbi:MAG: hypothetical protein ABFS23_01115 [Pseudomonadota bacterium]
MITLRNILVGVLVSSVFLLTGCGDDDDESVTVTAMDAAFELLAVEENAGIRNADILEKTARVENILGAIQTVIEGGASPVADAEVAYGSKPIGQVGSAEAIISYPGIDLDLDGMPDDIGRMIEVRFDGDTQFADAGLRYGVMLPWPVVAYTESTTDRILVVAAVPETWVRTFMRDSGNLEMLIDEAVDRRQDLEELVAEAVEALGFDIRNEAFAGGPVLSDNRIAELEGMFGPLNAQFSAPSRTLTTGFVGADTVAMAIENAFLADTVPDLDGDGLAGAAGDDGVLPSAMMGFLMGTLSAEDFGQMLADGAQVWAEGATFQDWVLNRTLSIPDSSAQEMQLVQVCQGFYVGTSLGFGMHHLPVMPCGIGVWEDETGVHVSIIDTRFLFGYFWSDVSLDPSDPMAQLFGIFPTFVYNELVATVNGALEGLGIPETDQFALEPIPTQ